MSLGLHSWMVQLWLQYKQLAWNKDPTKELWRLFSWNNNNKKKTKCLWRSFNHSWCRAGFSRVEWRQKVTVKCSTALNEKTQLSNCLLLITGALFFLLFQSFLNHGPPWILFSSMLRKGDYPWWKGNIVLKNLCYTWSRIFCRILRGTFFYTEMTRTFHWLNW